MLVALLLLVSLQSQAPSGGLSVQAVRLAPAPASALAAGMGPDEIVLDGRLDEAVWQLAPPARGFKQREPKEGADATDDTEVRILFDAKTLYIGVLARDSEPDRIIARILERDRLMAASDGRYRFGGDDAILFLLDPFHDRRSAVVFGTNANGAEYDALIADESQSWNTDWRGVWKVAAQRTAEGWSAEFAIPFRSLRYPSAGLPWGF
ncbi:MAG TPA: carbohydrate binding family 9 domain-containing protein, partial [Vicinamibacteria bacterium]|nr:carbohydrate binding family 9 domain-containing protein [Vicinamibacteria bacterium]